MPIEKFLPLYLKAHEEGLTKEEFARKLGVKPSTVYQRVYELRVELKGEVEIPLLKSEGKVSKLDKAREILASYGGGKAPKKKAVKAKAEEPEVEAQEEDGEAQLADIFGTEG
jgi:hypothetical protein